MYRGGKGDAIERPLVRGASPRREQVAARVDLLSSPLGPRRRFNFWPTLLGGAGHNAAGAGVTNGAPGSGKQVAPGGSSGLVGRRPMRASGGETICCFHLRAILVTSWPAGRASGGAGADAEWPYRRRKSSWPRPASPRPHL